MAPAAASSVAAAATAAATSGCDVGVAERRRVGDAQAGDAVVEPDPVVASSGGSDVQSRASGRFSTFIISAASATLIVCGPRWDDGAERRQRVRRHPPEARLEPDVAAERGRDADRSGAVGADARAGPGRRRPPPPCRPTSRRASCVGSHGLRVMPVSGRVGLALAAELRRRRLADQHRAGLAQARRRRRVDVPGLVGIDGAAAAQRRPARGQDQVLDRHRHAVERAARARRAASGPRSPRADASASSAGDEAERVELRVAAPRCGRARPASPRPARPRPSGTARAAPSPWPGSDRWSRRHLAPPPPRRDRPPDPPPTADLPTLVPERHFLSFWYKSWRKRPGRVGVSGSAGVVGLGGAVGVEAAGDDVEVRRRAQGDLAVGVGVADVDPAQEAVGGVRSSTARRAAPSWYGLLFQIAPRPSWWAANVMAYPAHEAEATCSHSGTFRRR